MNGMKSSRLVLVILVARTTFSSRLPGDHPPSTAARAGNDITRGGHGPAATCSSSPAHSMRNVPDRMVVGADRRFPCGATTAAGAEPGGREHDSPAACDDARLPGP